MAVWRFHVVLKNKELMNPVVRNSLGDITFLSL